MTGRAVLCAVVCWGGVLLSASPSMGQEAVTMSELLREMTDLEGLAEYPKISYRTVQASSYDRRSVSADQPEPPKEGWFANLDRGQYLRKEENAGRTEWVLMEHRGPGAIARIWSANPMGTLRIYVDKKPAPVLEADMKALLGGEVEGIPAPLAGERGRGFNLYLPIPFRSHCKVTCDKDDFYYHVTYREYERGVAVESFGPKTLEKYGDAIRQVAKKLARPRGAIAIPDEAKRSGRQMGIAPRISKVTAAKIDGGGAIRSIEVRTKAENLEKALRGMVLRIAFDGEVCVETPLGDFFGAAPGLNAFESLPCGVTDAGVMWAHWVMPFKESAEITLDNVSEEKVDVDVAVLSTPYKWTPRTLYFHADWRAEFGVPSRPIRDWRYLAVKGQGVYVGAAFNIGNPSWKWWGEGDEKIYIDDEEFPSTFGTGTEDYFGYAWCDSTVFTHAYHAQPRVDGPRNAGRTAVNRWHLLDRMPFESAFKFDMELWHWHEDVKVDAAVTAYWYGMADAKSLGQFDVKQARLEPLEMVVEEPPKK